ncbi:TPM domain-containing protein [Paenibacillus sp. F411]|uniref:TPM domain-containing protein n=1 Tax=Paenibacillus sp. F411 TaxID=2820239 RepID=UPI0032667A2F
MKSGIFARLRTGGLLMLAVLLLYSFPAVVKGEPSVPPSDKQLIWDDAGLLSPKEHERLNELAGKLGAERETDIIILTTLNREGRDVANITNDFYDQYAPGYDQPFGNTVILTLDMNYREVDLGGFQKAESYLNSGRLDQIRRQITPALTEGSYAEAFETYITEAYRYLGIVPDTGSAAYGGTDRNGSPGANGNVLHQTWFQLLVSAAIGAGVVGIMAYRSGGVMTVNRRSYENSASSGVLDREDQYIRTTVTKTKIPKSNSGPGGGTTGGGHSRSGSRGSF